MVHVLGIDLAAGAPSTGVVLLAPDPTGGWSAHEGEGVPDDDALVGQAVGAAVIGVDAPLGWPTAFVEAMAAHHSFEPWPGTPDRSTLTHRETDRATRDLVGRTPLSVSADRLGSVAMRCALLQRRWAAEVWGAPSPRDGSGPLVETYPAAALLAWGIDCRGYKGRPKGVDPAKVRTGVVAEIADATAHWLDLELVRERCVISDHVLDALICALVALAARAGATSRPSPAQASLARREGWIHVPTAPLGELAPPA